MALLCHFPSGIKVYMWKETRHGPHFHAIRGTGPGREWARFFWDSDPIRYEESGKRRQQLSNSDLKEVAEWAARHKAELDERWRVVMAGGSPTSISYK